MGNGGPCMAIRRSSVKSRSPTDPPAEGAGRKFKAHTYLAPATAEQLRRQLDYIACKGWRPAIQFKRANGAHAGDWRTWKVPLRTDRSPDLVLLEARSCGEKHPGHYVRLVAYDNRNRPVGAVMLIRRP